MPTEDASVELVELDHGLTHLSDRSRGAGKKIDTWIWRHGETDHIIQIDFRILSPRGRHRYKMATQRVWYLAYRPANPRIYMSGTEAEELRKKLFARLDRLYSIDFEKKLVVSCELSTNSYVGGERRASVELSWREVQIATRPDGSRVSRYNENDRTHDGWPEVSNWKQDRRDDDGVCLALIDDTPENREALAELIAFWMDVGRHIGGQVAPSQVLQNLKTMPDEITKALGLERTKRHKKR